jgi:hypothetical protein
LEIEDVPTWSQHFVSPTKQLEKINTTIIKMKSFNVIRVSLYNCPQRLRVCAGGVLDIHPPTTDAECKTKS